MKIKPEYKSIGKESLKSISGLVDKYHTESSVKKACESIGIGLAAIKSILFSEDKEKGNPDKIDE